MPCVREQVELLLGRVTGSSGLLRGDRGAQHDVAEQARLGFLVVVAGAQLVHREGQDVGRALLVHPLLVQRRHRRRHRRRAPTAPPAGAPSGGRARSARGPQTRSPSTASPDSSLTSMLTASSPWSGISVVGGRTRRSAAPCRGLAGGVPPAVRVDDVADQAVAYDVLARQPAELHVVDAVRMSCTTRRPLWVPPGRSTWVTSPVTTIFEPKPSRVRNIFICSAELFCASSRMMNASLRVLCVTRKSSVTYSESAAPTEMHTHSASPAGSMVSMKRIGRPPPAAS